MDHELAEICRDFLADRYRDEIGTLAQRYPDDQDWLTVSHSELYSRDPDLADDALDKPERMREYLEDGLARVELPADIDLSGASVRLADLPDTWTFYPGEFSPSEHKGTLRAVRGEIVKATDVYSRLQEAKFECNRCGTETRVPQPDDGFDEPYQCQGCERQGPFDIDRDESEFVDAQKLRIQTPPEEAHGDGQDIDAYVEGSLTDVAEVGDRVTATAIVDLDQQTRGNKQVNKFEPSLDVQHIAVEQTDAEDVDISQDQRERIRALANGAEGDPLEVAAASLAPKIHGYDTEKRALVLALVGGSRVDYPSGDFDRGEFHVLFIGDPSTAKSKLVNRAEQVGWRTVGVSGSGATVAGVTATAVQDDFGDGSWTLDAGAAVKAHRGLLAVDELDDMPAEVRSALLEPMSKQTIHITKGGINTHLQTRTAVVAAANPEHGRFDPYEPIAQQFTFDPTLLSRFDLVYTFRDVPDKEEDADIAEHILSGRDAAKRLNNDEALPEDATDPRPPVEPELFRAWIALAKQQDEPSFETDAVKDNIKESFTSLRGMYGYDDPDEPVPVTFRSLEGIVRVAEAAAKFEFCDTIQQRHVDIATDLVGQSMQDIGKDEDGNLDADIAETGQSQSQRSRKQAVIEAIRERQAENGKAECEEVIADLSDDYDEHRIEKDLQTFLNEGEASEPQTGYIRYIGSH